MEFNRGMIGTLQSGYYLDKGYQSAIRVWGAAGWLSLDLISGAPLQWRVYQSNRTEAMEPTPTAPDHSYRLFVQQAIRSAQGDDPPVTGTECLDALRAVFALYEAASTGRTQQLS
jgi:predicted dehydrogenase